MAYVHPVIGFLVVSTLLWVASLGLRARQRRPSAAAARATHSRLAPVVLVVAVGTAVVGTVSVAWLRDDLTVARSWHFRVAWTVVGLLIAASLVSRRFGTVANARQAHALIGVTAALGALVGLLLGLGILPD